MMVNIMSGLSRQICSRLELLRKFSFNLTPKNTKITPFGPFKTAIIWKPLVPLGSKFFLDPPKNISFTFYKKEDQTCL
mgnify:CR=1 FL=1